MEAQVHVVNLMESGKLEPVFKVQTAVWMKTRRFPEHDSCMTHDAEGNFISSPN
jgi:hypothetical protein